MSKRVDATITCPVCGKQYQFSLYRTIWGEYEENKQLVLSDKINVSTCPSCNSKTKLEYPFMYVDIKKQFAVWWEPHYDSQIDKEAVEYGKMFGEGNFYHKAPRIKDWQEFKELVLRYYSGELKGNPLTISNQQKKAFEGVLKGMVKDIEKKKNKNSGCFGVLALIMIIGFTIFILTKFII